MLGGSSRGTLSHPTSSRPTFVNLLSGPKAIVLPKPKAKKVYTLQRSTNLDEYVASPSFKVVGISHVPREDVPTVSASTFVPLVAISVETLVTPTQTPDTESPDISQEFFDSPDNLSGVTFDAYRSGVSPQALV